LTAPAVSTLIEFPGAGRAARPQWRKQLSERVREIQERRAREAEEAARRPQEAPTDEPLAPQLGLVPPPDVPQINPLVAAALRRIERAYQPSASPASRTRGGGGAATAVARFVEDEYQPEQQQRPAPVEAQTSLPKPEKALAEKPSEAAAAHGLVVVAAPAPQTTARTQADKSDAPHRRAAARVIDDAVLEGQETEDAAAIPFVEPYDDRGAVHRRVFAAVVDLLVVAFAASPFAAIIELTNGNWADLRVSASMGGIILIIMFLYLTASTALSGRTWGMSLVSLRPVDAETGLPPTTRQSVLRALLYMGSLITACLGILYALFDAEGRAAHDHLSGTVVVRE
jgi:uncharacterized RDD family membrane protein YckC